jgi:hypothetical protein
MIELMANGPQVHTFIVTTQGRNSRLDHDRDSELSAINTHVAKHSWRRIRDLLAPTSEPDQEDSAASSSETGTSRCEHAGLDHGELRNIFEDNKNSPDLDITYHRDRWKARRPRFRAKDALDQDKSRHDVPVDQGRDRRLSAWNYLPALVELTPAITSVSDVSLSEQNLLHFCEGVDLIARTR